MPNYDENSPLSEQAQDSLANADIYVGGSTGVTTPEALAELQAAGYITPKFNLTRSGVPEAVRLYEIYFETRFYKGGNRS